MHVARAADHAGVKNWRRISSSRDLTIRTTLPIDADSPWSARPWCAPDGASLRLWSHRDEAPERPLLVFAHATGLNGYAYRRLLEPLAGHARLRAWDMRGHGGSEVGPAGESLTDWDVYYADLAALLEQLGEPVVLAGHSVGGMTCAAVAARHPERVRGLVLLDPVIIGGWPWWALRLGRLFGKQHEISLAVGARRRRPQFESVDAVLAAYRGRSIFRDWPDEWLRDYIQAGFVRDGDGVRLACSPEFEARSFAATEYRPWSRLKGIRCPVTALVGERGSTMPAASRRRLQRLCPQLELRTLPGSSHMLPFEQPDVVRAALAAMLAHSPT